MIHLEESAFHTVAEAYLEQLFEKLESLDESSALDLDYEPGRLQITLPTGEIFLISKHAASQEMWLSSPISGGLHFSLCDGGSDWKLKDGRRLSIVLSEELHHLTGEMFELL